MKGDSVFFAGTLTAMAIFILTGVIAEASEVDPHWAFSYLIGVLSALTGALAGVKSK